jgi:hypothetical protein
VHSDRSAGDVSNHINHLVYRHATTCAEVDGDGFPMVEQMFQS